MHNALPAAYPMLYLNDGIRTWELPVGSLNPQYHHHQISQLLRSDTGITFVSISDDQHQTPSCIKDYEHKAAPEGEDELSWLGA